MLFHVTRDNIVPVSEDIEEILEQSIVIRIGLHTVLRSLTPVPLKLNKKVITSRRYDLDIYNEDNYVTLRLKIRFICLTR